MKRNLIRVLCMAMALCLLLSCCASAEIIQIYGDGSKKSYDIKDKFGVTYHYYDFLNGATKRIDTKDASRFIRSVLSTEFRGAVNRTVHEIWDTKGRNSFVSEGTDIKVGGKNVLEKYEEIIKKSNSYTNEWKVLVESKGMAATELAIREKMAQLGRDEMGDKKLKASSFKVNKELQSLKSDNGMTFFSMNAYGSKGSRFLAVGSVFYDFVLAYLEDGKIADSAVGNAQSLEEVKGKRGVKVADSTFKVEKRRFLENQTSQKVRRNTGYNETYSVSLGNTISHTSGKNRSWMVGAEVTVRNKIPLLGKTEVKVKGEYRSGWMSQTTEGSSKTVSESLSFKDEVGYDVPPHTKAEALLMKADGSYSLEYDYPIVILYKVAQYVIYNDEVNQLYALWGESGDTTNSHAVQNLYNRYGHRNENGYEAVHSSGYPIKWNSIRPSDFDSEFTDVLCKYIPMSITGGCISMNGVQYKIVIKDPVPIAPLSSVKTDGVRALRVAAEGSLDLAAVAPITALDNYNGESVPFYGFDETKYGDWVFTDASGNPAQSSLAELVENDKGEWTLKAGKEAGEVYIKYMLDEDLSYDIGVGSEEAPAYESVAIENDDIKNETLIQVKIEAQPSTFDGKVAISGPVEAALNQPVNLSQSGPELAFTNAEGTKLDAEDVEFPQVWSVAGGNSEDISIINNRLTVKKDGAYKVLVTVGGVSSEPVDVTIIEGIHPSSITLDKGSVTLTKGDTMTLSATVFPVEAVDKSVIWKSENEKVVTVDQNGKIKAIGTGFTAVTATTGDGGLIAVCDVTVEVPEDGKALDQANLALVKGKSFKLGTPGGASGMWSVKDSSIATVNDAGKVTGAALGETTLYFKVESVKHGAKFMGKDIAVGDIIEVPVAVRAKGEVVNKITLGAKKLTIAVDAKHTLEPVFKPANAKDLQVYYKSSDKSVALVDDFGVISGVSSGKAKITATSASGKTAVVNVTVTNDVGGITLSEKKLKLVPGEVYKLIATPVPAFLAGFAPVFESGKPGVATVDADGVITAIAKGKTTITVYAAPGSKVKAKCKVTVK